MSEEIAWTEFEATVLATDYVGQRTDAIKAAAAWVREAKLAVLEEARKALHDHDQDLLYYGGATALAEALDALRAAIEKGGVDG
jgi:hypothetical protein